jgi:hypothetical protein
MYQINPQNFLMQKHTAFSNLFTTDQLNVNNNLIGWLVVVGIVLLTFIIVWALLINRPHLEEQTDSDDGNEHH